MPAAPITGRDIELIAVGFGCFVTAGVLLAGDSITLVHFRVQIFLFVGLVSLGLAWWDLRARGASLVDRDDR